MNQDGERSLPWWAAFVLTAVAALGTGLTLLIAGAARAAARKVSLGVAMHMVGRDLLDLGFAQAAGVGLALVIGLRVWRRGARPREALGIKPVSNGAIALALVAGFAFQFPLAEIANLVSTVFPVPLREQLARQQMITPTGAVSAIVILLSVVVIAPVSEELLFRGLFLRGLRARYGPIVALGLSSLLFGLSHGEPHAVVYALCAGLVLGGVALRTGSTLPSMAMHAAVNAVPILLPSRLVPIPGFNTVGRAVYHVPLALLAVATLVTVAALAWLLRTTEDGS